MSDADCVRFLQWALPQLRMRWSGFRKVRRQVCRRVDRRRRELGLPDLDAYHAHLESRPDEWSVLDGLCRITVSRFYRDQRLFASLETEVLPVLAATALARGDDTLEVWSAGCASGEEPYSLALVWELALARRFPGLRMRILATDTDAAMLRRAREACYGPASLRELPERWRSRGFVEHDRMYRLRPEYGRLVTLLRHDVRAGAPDGPFHLLLCRNLVFTYFELELQCEAAGRFALSLRPDAALVVGAHEAVPEEAGLAPWPDVPGVYRKIGALPDAGDPPVAASSQALEDDAHPASDPFQQGYGFDRRSFPSPSGSEDRVLVYEVRVRGDRARSAAPLPDVRRDGMANGAKTARARLGPRLLKPHPATPRRADQGFPRALIRAATDGRDGSAVDDGLNHRKEQP